MIIVSVEFSRKNSAFAEIRHPSVKISPPDFSQREEFLRMGALPLTPGKDEILNRITTGH